MPESFSFVLPDLPSLKEIKTKIKSAPLSSEHTSFFDILNQLIYNHYHTLLEPSDYIFMLDCINQIWNSTTSTTLPPCLSKLSAEKNHLEDLTSLIVIARIKTIEIQKKMDFSKEKNIFKYLKETHKRLQFMINIDFFVKKDSFGSDHCNFYTGLFDDIINTIKNISAGLFEQYFTGNFKDLKCYWEYSNEKSDSLTKKILASNKQNNNEFLLKIWKRIASMLISVPKYYVAIGEDNKAFNYSVPSSSGENLDIKKSNPELGKKLEKILEDYELNNQKEFLQECTRLMYIVGTDDKRKMYIKFRACFKNEAQKGEINTQEYLLQAPLETILKENLAQLQKYTEVNNKMCDLIQNSILSLGLAYEQSYNKNRYNAELCIQIINHLEKIIKKDKSSIIASDICEHLASHKNIVESSIKTFKNTLEQSETELKSAQERLKTLKAQRASLEQTHKDTLTEKTQKLEALKEKELALQKIKNNYDKEKKEKFKKNIEKLTRFNNVKKQDIEQSKKTLKSLEDKIKELQKQNDAFNKVSIKTQKEKATQLEEEKAYKESIEKLNIKNKSNQKKIQETKKNIALLEVQLQKTYTTVTDLQTQKKELIEKSNPETAALKEKVDQLTALVQQFQEQYANLLTAYNADQEALCSRYKPVPFVDSVNRTLDDIWDKNLQGFYNVYYFIIQDMQSQCQRAVPPQIVYALRPNPYLPSRELPPPLPANPQPSFSSSSSSKPRVRI